MLNIKHLKIIILGSSKVGKTSILQRYFNNEFSEEVISTIGVEHQTKYFKFDDDKIRIDYIDTAGQERHQSIASNYLKKADGVILVFDITKRETFELVNHWIKEINTNKNMNNIGLILLGNKIDLINQRNVESDEGEKLASNINCKYIEVSAKTGSNITEALEEIAKETYKKYKFYGNDNMSFNLENKSFKPDINNKEEKSKLRRCCRDI